MSKQRPKESRQVKEVKKGRVGEERSSSNRKGMCQSPVLRGERSSYLPGCLLGCLNELTAVTHGCSP